MTPVGAIVRDCSEKMTLKMPPGRFSKQPSKQFIYSDEERRCRTGFKATAAFNTVV